MQTPADLIHFSRNMKSFIKGGENVDITGEGTEQFPLIISSTGNEGIQSIVEGDNISIDNTDPSNPIVSVSGIDVPEQHFVEITEGSNTGYGTKHRADNPDYYGNIGANAIDLGFSTSASSTRGARGQYSTVSGGQNNTASGSQSTVSGGQNITANGIASTVSGGNSNTANGISSTVSGGNSNTASGNASTVSGGQNNTASGTQSTVSGGESNTANSYMSWFGGRFSTLFTGQSTNSWVPTDILFNIGNGTGGSSRSNALSLFKNGRLELPSYGDGAFTGTATKMLAVDATGNVIEEDLPTSGGSLTITDNDLVEAENVNTINFIGATVTDNEDGSVDVEYDTTQTVKQAKVTITAAQMATLGDNPITIIPAQGARTIINPISASFYLDFNTTPYDISSSMDFVINTDGILSIGSPTINSASTIYTSTTRTGFVTSNQENQPLLLATVSNPTQGDSDITIIITYTVDNFN